MNYTIWVVSPKGYKHSLCFNETALALHTAFKELGYTVPVLYECPHLARGKIIVLGAHLLGHPAKSADWIIYNLEQISVETSPGYLKILESNEVWDYSANNVAALRDLGITAKHVPLGYSSSMRRVFPQQEKFDVLFYGSMNPRREKILERLKASGAKVLEKFGVYGSDLDYWIARSRIIVNIHFYETRIFEMTRCSYLMANEKCIVSEEGNDKEMEAVYKPAVSFVPYDGIVEECVRLIGSNTERWHRARKGFEIFSAHKQSDYLRAVV